MVDMAGNYFFEEDDEFFADAFRSISEIESSSLKVAVESSSVENRNESNVQLSSSSIKNEFKNFYLAENKNESNIELVPSSNKNELLNSYSIISSSNDKSNFCNIKNSKDFGDYHAASPLANESCLNQDKNSQVNQRFHPGYTPKAIKRKFPGPAGVFIDEPPRKLSIGGLDSSKNFEPAEIEFEAIKSSQLSTEELFETVSWKKLQEDVSSNQSFLSCVKHFSVQQVLSDTSKKRLPKHIVVPMLCLYVKKFNSEEPISIYMDDTGEITGKIGKDVLELYGHYIKTGTSLVLKKITFVCNVMLLEKSNMVSLYLEDGTVHHLQNWDTLIEDEPSSALSCIFPVTPKMLEKSVKLENLKTPLVSKQTPNRTIELVSSSSSRTFSSKKINPVNFISPQTSLIENLDAKNQQNISIDAANLSHPDLEMDDFDELMGNLDENSFLEDF